MCLHVCVCVCMYMCIKLLNMTVSFFQSDGEHQRENLKEKMRMSGVGMSTSALRTTSPQLLVSPPQLRVMLALVRFVTI